MTGRYLIGPAAMEAIGTERNAPDWSGKERSQRKAAYRCGMELNGLEINGKSEMEPSIAERIGLDMN